MDYLKHYRDKFLFIRQLLQKENPVIVEIGAHYGEDSLRFLQVFKELKLFCFEPDPRNIKMFKKFVNDERVNLYEIALSNKTETAEFYQSYQEYDKEEVPLKYDWIELKDYKEKKLNNSGSSSLKRGYSHILKDTIQVKTKRFADWYNDSGLKEIDFVWIDTQGAEKDVLDGMGDVILNIKFIWIEYGEFIYEESMTRQETISYMNNKGFKTIEEASDNGPTGDLLFVRNDNV